MYNSGTRSAARDARTRTHAARTPQQHTRRDAPRLVGLTRSGRAEPRRCWSGQEGMAATWRAAAEAHDSAAAAAGVSPISGHTTFCGDAAAQASPTAAVLFRSPRSSTNSAQAEDGPPPVLSVLARLLEETVGQHERRASEPGAAAGAEAPNLFCGLRAPAIPLASYLQRIFKYANCSPACYVLAFIYLERLVANDATLRITSLSVHRLLVTSVLVAAKFLDDSYFNNAYYSKVGGISLVEINALEVDLLTRLDFRLHVQPEEFEGTCARLCGRLEPGDVDASAAAEAYAAYAVEEAEGSGGYSTRAVATA